MNDLEKVLKRLSSFGLKLRPDKCALFQRQVKFLGHVVSGEGVLPDPEKIACVQNWVTPQTASQVRSFLGFAGYYRRFIAGFSKIAQPLNALLAGVHKCEKKAMVQWSTDCEESFKTLKEALAQAPVLDFADFALPFRVYTDASLTGLGAVLAQVQDGKERVIAYASRSFHPAERNDANYSSFKLELLALKWAVTDKFKDFLWGTQFTVFTDNNPLVHLQSAKLGAVEQRWVAQLANYHFDVKYRPGKENANVDVLSRLPLQVQSSHPPKDTSEVETSTVHAVRTPGHWQPLQEEDPIIQRLRYYISRGQPPTKRERSKEPAAVTRLLGQWDRLAMVDGVLIRWVQDPASKEVMSQTLVPLQHQWSTWDEYHRHQGHLGAAKICSILLSINPKWKRMWPTGHPGVKDASDVSHIPKVKHP